MYHLTLAGAGDGSGGNGDGALLLSRPRPSSQDEVSQTTRCIIAMHSVKALPELYSMVILKL